jgi:hypothetical protein
MPEVPTLKLDVSTTRMGFRIILLKQTSALIVCLPNEAVEPVVKLEPRVDEPRAFPKKEMGVVAHEVGKGKKNKFTNTYSESNALTCYNLLPRL